MVVRGKQIFVKICSVVFEKTEEDLVGVAKSLALL